MATVVSNMLSIYAATVMSNMLSIYVTAVMSNKLSREALCAVIEQD